MQTMTESWKTPSLEALGLVETRGLVPAVAAADAAVKTAAVSLLGLERVGAGLVTVTFTGDLSSVQAALDAADATARSLGEVVSATVIGRTGEGLETLLMPVASSPSALPDLSRLRVTRLRGLARAAVAGPDGAGFPLTPEEIKFARKDDLIRTLTEFAQTTGNLPDLNMVEKE